MAIPIALNVTAVPPKIDSCDALEKCPRNIVSIGKLDCAIINSRRCYQAEMI